VTDPPAGRLEQLDGDRVAERRGPGGVLGGQLAALVEGGPEPLAATLARRRLAVADRRTTGQPGEIRSVASRDRRGSGRPPNLTAAATEP
jgi:hypothetical protein